MKAVADKVRFGREHAAKGWQFERVVVQFRLRWETFDAFFNGRTGYRAHFWTSPERGLEFNDAVVAAIVNGLEALPKTVHGRELDHAFDDRGLCEIPKTFVGESLLPTLSKLWPVTRRIGLDGITEDSPTPGWEAGAIVLAHRSWSARSPAADWAWLDVKGAFIGGGEAAYAGTPPMVRARKLAQDGMI